MTSLRLLWTGIFCVCFLLACQDQSSQQQRNGLTFTQVDFQDLEGFDHDQLSDALPALGRSCTAILNWPPLKPFHTSGRYGTVNDWKAACLSLVDLSNQSDARSQAFKTRLTRKWLETFFTPWLVSVSGSSTGTFTGYFEPLLEGSFKADDRYRYPLYARPVDLIDVDLGVFRADLEGEKIKGRLEGTRLVPYPDRSEILSGALSAVAKPLLYVDSQIDAFFLHIQGSGRVRLPDGRLQAVGYADRNGHPYSAIGPLLRDRGEIEPDRLSMQSIRAWLEDHPDQALDLLLENKSYIFFRLVNGKDGPFGSAGVALTPERSLAVDRRYLAMHLPMWLATSHPDPGEKPFYEQKEASFRSQPPESSQQPFNRLMVAQDTGGAIRGEVRGDVFWGFGERAAEISGRMAHKGRYWIFLPKGLDPNIASEPAVAKS